MTPTDRRPTETDYDITPWSLRIKKINKSTSMPFHKCGSGGQGRKESDRELKRGFLGMNVPLSPRLVVILCVYWIRKKCRIEPCGAKMAWPLVSPATATKLIPDFSPNLSQWSS
ncbi:hypothetical protein B9Z19DRAFT_1068659 [Tuber borchii]|uniref:Uncharacterized protein n=1 Tax=Tuber borchii TaxID=42251 RepID=A0A2T6ZEC1_TUBBO|nr:hypothetical protein B9Z19DRAFT_1068659 [Tuber borchii]